MSPTSGILISAGIPGTKKHDESKDVGEYPIAAQDLSKILRERGIPVEFQHDREHRQYVSLHSAELWLPIINTTTDVLVGLGGVLLSDLIRDLILRPGDTGPTTLHVEYYIADAKGDVHELKVTGDSAEVYPVIDRFEANWKHRDADDD